MGIIVKASKGIGVPLLSSSSPHPTAVGMNGSPSLILRSRSNVSLLPVCAPPQAKSSSNTTRIVLSLFGVTLVCVAGYSGSGAPVRTVASIDPVADASNIERTRLLTAELAADAASTAAAAPSSSDAATAATVGSTAAAA